MGIELSEREVDEFLSAAHTLKLATIRKSGEPFLTPVWFIWMDGAFWIRTASNSPKVRHLTRDPRVCCMVEDGEKWIDLRAVVANCDATIVEDRTLKLRVLSALGGKYAAFGKQDLAVPEATQKHYAHDIAVICMRPRPGEFRSWDNHKIRLRPSRSVAE